MPWPWIIILGLIGIGVFNLGANFLLSPRWLGLPLIGLLVGLVLAGQSTVAIGGVSGGVMFAGAVLLTVVQWRQPTAVPRKQIWWAVVLGAVALLAVGLTALNGRVSRLESWALTVGGVVSYLVVPRAGERLPWWRWAIGLTLVAGSSALIAWAMPTMVAISGWSPLLVGTLLVPCCLISTTVWLWRQRQQLPTAVLLNAVLNLQLGLTAVGYGLIGVLSGAWVVSATTGWLTLPWLGLMFFVAVTPLLTRQKTTRVGGVAWLVLYLTYWLLLGI